MKVSGTNLSGVVLIEPTVFDDPRGLFYESWSESRYADAGVPGPFVQDNISSSTQGTLRGLHLQHPFGQGKLVHVLVGEVFDVVVDVRVGSPNFGRWTGATLSESNRHQLYVPPGFAHGFCVVSDTALFVYKCTEYYRPETEIIVAWDDPDIGIRWPFAEPTLSRKDRAGAALSSLTAQLPHYVTSEEDLPGSVG
jgi:dTDP-4-dehydrorhamnose 3,5-epimerase